MKTVFTNVVVMMNKIWSLLSINELPPTFYNIHIRLRTCSKSVAKYFSSAVLS